MPAGFDVMLSPASAVGALTVRVGSKVAVTVRGTLIVTSHWFGFAPTTVHPDQLTARPAAGDAVSRTTVSSAKAAVSVHAAPEQLMPAGFEVTLSVACVVGAFTVRVGSKVAVTARGTLINTSHWFGLPPTTVHPVHLTARPATGVAVSRTTVLSGKSTVTLHAGPTQDKPAGLDVTVSPAMAVGALTIRFGLNVADTARAAVIAVVHCKGLPPTGVQPDQAARS